MAESSPRTPSAHSHPNQKSRFSSGRGRELLRFGALPLGLTLLIAVTYALPMVTARPQRSLAPNPAATFSLTELTFPLLPVGATSEPQAVTLTNTGTGEMKITSVTVSGDDHDDFAQTNTCGTDLSPGESCTVTVTFRPLADGLRTASVEITDDAAGSPQLVVLTGFGGSIPPPDPLGTITGSSPTSCPTGTLSGTCTQLSISCPNIPNDTATIKVTAPAGQPVGTVIFIGGGGGGTLYEDEFTYGASEISTVVTAGYTAVQMIFAGSNGWLEGPATNGPRATACRPATAFQWIYHNVHQGDDEKPLCGTGNSAGAAALGYAVAQYGLGSIFSMIEPTSGPPMGRMDIGCLCNQPNVESLCLTGLITQCYNVNANKFIDPSYGNSDCSNHDPSQSTLWLTDSVASPDANYAYPSTFVHALFGGQDTSPAPALGLEWMYAVTTNKAIECVLDAPHPMPDAQDAAEKIASDITSGCTLQTKASGRQYAAGTAK